MGTRRIGPGHGASSARRWQRTALAGVLARLTGCSFLKGSDDQTTVDAYGQGRTGSSLDRLVGIETLGGVFTEIVAAGCPLPCEVTQIFSTAADDQTQIALHLYRGPAGLVSEAEAIGSWEVTGFALLGALCVPIIERLPFQRPVVATLGGFASGRPKASPAAHVVRHPLGSGVLAAPTVATLFGLREARRQPEQDLERQVVCVAADLKPFRGAFRLP